MSRKFPPRPQRLWIDRAVTASGIRGVRRENGPPDRFLARLTSAPSAHPAHAASAGSIRTDRAQPAPAAGSAPWVARRPSPAKRKED
ncbi:hypothetical protein GCM10011363_46070 [Marivita lacus]|uniref:Uncharacterized protein n=1 Tax=Marivita lacus TaxID=1323742 RepID=A0ABQ1LGZ2_9RHOB|nr:hypothetical protein GCM10011363_46070 [Marivita lacus]